MTITYDAIGNPLNDGTWSYTWQQGRQLASMTRGDETWTYTYDVNGMRTKRVMGEAEYTYVYNGGQLTHMFYGSTSMHFTYGADGRPLTVVHNGATYYYVTNLQGDVVALLDSTGAQVVGYTYDAWGRPLTVTGSKASTLGQYNPLRYRGYVYDRETSLYYLQSRYYNPEIGRFISADKYISTEQDILGSNMYAYCLNNPMNHVDSTGTLAVSLSLLILGTVIGGVFSAGIDAGMQLYENGGDISELDVGSIIKSGLVGCALGLSTSMGVGYLGPIISGTATFSASTAAAAFGISVGVSALAGGTGYAIEERLNNREISAKGILVNAGITALQSAVNFGAGGMSGSIGNVGTKGPFLHGEWFGKFALVQEFSFPFKYTTNMLIDIFE